MDETFAFVAPVMPRRSLHPLALRAGITAAVFVAAVGGLGVYVAEHEQAADARRAARETRLVQAEEARLVEAAQVEVPAGIEGGVEQAGRDAAEEALGYAQTAFAADGSFANAGPGSLTAAVETNGSELLMVDGPSTMPSIVSVAVADDLWAAAVATADGCLWISLAADGSVTRERGGECTGAAALAATGTGW